jgi:hypothetical protein
MNHERDLSMNDSSLSLAHHLAELRQVGADLRAERAMIAAPASSEPGRLRAAAGRALIGLGETLLGRAAPRPAANRRTQYASR